MFKWHCDSCGKLVKQYVSPPEHKVCSECCRRDWKENGTPCLMCDKRFSMEEIEKSIDIRGETVWCGIMTGPDRNGQPTQHYATRWKGGYRCINGALKPEDEGKGWRRINV